MATNLPANSAPKDSATPSKTFFDTYYQQGITLPAGLIDAAVGFFESKGFDATAAQSVAATLLKQAKIENVDAFKLLDTLKGLNNLQLNRVVSEILNYNRLRISTLGYSVDVSRFNQYELRNILP